MNALIDKIGASVVRTVTPYLIGFAVTFLASKGFDWKPSPEVFALVGQAVAALFYTAVRYAEVNIAPKFGWLLGAIGAPKYVVPKAATEDVSVAL